MGKKSKNKTKAWENNDVIVEPESRVFNIHEIQLVPTYLTIQNKS